jgi:hypothetical protein
LWKVVRVLDIPVLGSKASGRQIRQAYVEELRRVSLLAKQLEVVPGKASKLQLNTTVPQTDTGVRDEYSQALERTAEKELGKLTP